MKRIREVEELQWAELVLPYLPPPDLASVASTCKSLRRLSLSITARRSSDASRSFEKHPIPFLNSVDSQPYSYFLYAPSPLLSSSPTPQSWGGSSSPTPPEPASPLADSTIGSGCDCHDCSADPNVCPCSSIPNSSQIITECGSGCRCGPDCANRSTQRGISVRLKIVRDPKKGWGLHADQFIKAGDFICEYAGEFLTTEEARRRQRIYDDLASRGKISISPALLVVREHLPSGKACLRVNIDATRIGNAARFINHSCDGGNLSAAVVRRSGSLLPRLCFFAAVDIGEGEELSFSYGDGRIRPRGLPCFCGTDACHGQLPSEET